MNVLLVIAILILFFFMLRGFQKGFMRKLASILSLVLSIVIVSAALPRLTTYIKANTPVYSFLVLQCQRVLQSEASGQTRQNDEFAKTGSGLIDRGLIKSVLEGLGLDGSIIDDISDEEIESLGREYLGEEAVDNYLESGDLAALDPYNTFGLNDGASSESAGGEAGLSGGASGGVLTQVQQTELIQRLKLPRFIQELLIANNNKSGYAKLSAQSFQQYIVHYLATILLNVLTFFVAFIVVRFLLWIVFKLLNLLVKLPVLNLVNRVLGMAVGGAQGVLLIWLLMLVVFFCTATELGAQAMVMIQESAVLSWLYETNVFLKIILYVMGAIV